VNRQRIYISRDQLLRASRRPGPGQSYRIDGLEAVARANRVDLPHMPREWRGYRASLIKRLLRVVGVPGENWGR
jgi:hypothetical protein